MGQLINITIWLKKTSFVVPLRNSRVSVEENDFYEIDFFSAIWPISL